MLQHAGRPQGSACSGCLKQPQLPDRAAGHHCWLHACSTSQAAVLWQPALFCFCSPLLCVPHLTHSCCCCFPCLLLPHQAQDAAPSVTQTAFKEGDNCDLCAARWRRAAAPSRQEGPPPAIIQSLPHTAALPCVPPACHSASRRQASASPLLALPLTRLRTANPLGSELRCCGRAPSPRRCGR